MTEELIRFLNLFHDTLFLIEDKDGNILYPTDKSIFDYESNLVKISDDRYFSPISNTWYQYDTFKTHNSDFVIKRWTDITKYVKKEDLYDLDPVTGIYLRRKLLEEFKEYLLFVKEHNEDFTVCIGDLDKFKRVNDTYGHLAGDEVLRSIARILSNGIRHNLIPSSIENENRTEQTNNHRDIIGRYGGEEFLLLIKNISKTTSLSRLENIRSQIQNSPVYYRYPNDGTEVNIPITISFGAVHVNPNYIRRLDINESNLTEHAKLIIEQADDNLYLAKKTRNTTVLSSIK